MKNRNEVLKRKMEGYLKKEQLFKSYEHKKLEKPFLAKSRKNFAVANLLCQKPPIRDWWHGLC